MADVFKNPYSSTEPAKEMAKRLPFKIGQVVEAKSFSQGYRGAWFVCKIVEIDKGGRNQLRYKFKYVHFPEEPLHWSQAYQQRYRGQIDSTELMLRPLPPPILHEKDACHATYDGIVVVPYVWEVGDLVNWWCDDVWWEATVTEIKANGKVKISLFKPPLGEGGVHLAEALELRPSLLWSNLGQWSLPISKKKVNGKPAARIIELSSSRWLKVLDQQAGVAVLGKAPSTENMLTVLSGQGKQLILATSDPPVKWELGQDKSLDGTISDAKTIPCLEVLRRAAEPYKNTTEGSHMENNLYSPPPQDMSQQEKCTSSGTMDDDSEDMSDALQLKRQIFRRRNRKFMRYRKHINRAIELERRMRFKKHVFADCKIIDSSEDEV